MPGLREIRLKPGVADGFRGVTWHFGIDQDRRTIQRRVRAVELDPATDEQELVPAGLGRVRCLQKHDGDSKNGFMSSHKVPSIMEPLALSVVGNSRENPRIVPGGQKTPHVMSRHRLCARCRVAPS